MSGECTPTTPVLKVDRWNKLDLLHYNSTNLMTGENLELSLKNQKPFYFSK